MLKDHLTRNPLRFHVSNENIQEGEPGYASTCAVAKCLNGHGYEARIYSDSIRFFEEGTNIQIGRYLLSDNLKQWLKRFDNREEVRPFMLALYDRPGEYNLAELLQEEGE